MDFRWHTDFFDNHIIREEKVSGAPSAVLHETKESGRDFFVSKVTPPRASLSIFDSRLKKLT